MGIGLTEGLLIAAIALLLFGGKKFLNWDEHLVNQLKDSKKE